MSGYALRWHGLQLRRGDSVVATVVADKDWPKLYRIHLSDGRITDIANLTGAKDAAAALALSVLDERDAA
jgi:hypothetical protein